MLTQLIFTNIYFIVYVFSALAFFASGWIHFDSWKIDKKNIAYLTRSIGFFAIAASLITTSIQPDNWMVVYTLNILKLYGGIMILVSLVMHPMVKNPTAQGFFPSFLLPTLPISLTLVFTILSPFIFILTSVFYLLRMIRGMEKQLKGAVFSIVLFTLSEIFKVLYLWSDSKNVFINNLLSQYGLLTWIVLFLIFASSVVLVIWVWGYVRFRASVQIFLTTLGFTLTIFIVTTFTFTFLLLKNIEENILDSLLTNAKVVQYSIEQLEFQALASVKSISQNTTLINNLVKPSRDRLYQITNTFMVEQNLSFLDTTDTEGQVIIAAEDKDLKNMSLSENPTVKSALNGKPLATVYIKDGVDSPQITVQASYPVFDASGKKLIGSVMSGFWADNAFLDGIKETTGIEIMLYSGNIKSASTILTSQDNLRMIGTEETNKEILDNVLKNANVWKGSGKVSNQPYYFAYTPLKKQGDDPIGMIAVGKPQIVLFKTAQKSIDTTFMVSAILIVISIFPSYFIAKFIEENITA